jgi:hypothetical protein
MEQICEAKATRLCVDSAIYEVARAADELLEMTVYLFRTARAADRNDLRLAVADYVMLRLLALWSPSPGVDPLPIESALLTSLLAREPAGSTFFRDVDAVISCADTLADIGERFRSNVDHDEAKSVVTDYVELTFLRTVLCLRHR